QNHHYPFYGQDPFEDAYVRWVDGRPEFTDQAHSLLRRYNRITKDPIARTDVDEQLQQYGIVVRQHQNQLQARRAFSWHDPFIHNGTKHDEQSGTASWRGKR